MVVNCISDAREQSESFTKDRIKVLAAVKPLSPSLNPKLQKLTQYTQPLEPILIPKLRIQFADFPYLHYSIDQRLFTSETCCGYGYELVRVRRHLPGIFKVQPVARGCRENFGTLRLSQNPFSVRDDSRASAAYAEKTTLPRAPAGVSRSRRVATTDRGSESVPLPGSGIWTGFPFGVTVALFLRDTTRLIKASPKP